MVSAYGVADLGFLAILLAEFHTYLGMRQFVILVSHFAYIVQQTCATCRLGVQPEFGSHGSAEVRRLA